jgi:hypothetical protein
MSLKSQDVLVGLQLALRPDETWTYQALHRVLKISVGELYKSMQRLKQARLIDVTLNLTTLNRASFEEFLIHGVKYVFPAQRGPRTRGMPTGSGASPLKELLLDSPLEPPVWPHPEGGVWGYEFSPLYKSVPEVALSDAPLYEWLALLDGIRGGSARERRLAEELLRQRLHNTKSLKE